jgi:hypothetical protein
LLIATAQTIDPEKLLWSQNNHLKRKEFCHSEGLNRDRDFSAIFGDLARGSCRGAFLDDRD